MGTSTGVGICLGKIISTKVRKRKNLDLQICKFLEYKCFNVQTIPKGYVR